jgi:HB1, ASXL, restriction endonuclease HTH domain
MATALPRAKVGDSLLRYVPYATASLVSDDLRRIDAFAASADLEMIRLRSVTALADAPPDQPWPQRPAERGSMIEAAIWVLEEEDNRAMRAREIWTLIESRELYNRSRGKTP